MKYLILGFLLSINIFCFSQSENQKADTVKKKSLLIDHSKDKPKAKYDQYRIITLQHDTTYVDTTLTIQKLYKFNYLRKDIFGLLPFTNEGQTYNTLNFGFNRFAALPEMGFRAKNFNFLSANEINYYSVATPLTELYYKTVMEQGQTLHALITVNLSESLNLSISYKGLRSLGKYINQLSSSGNFVFTTTYATKTNRYNLNFHYADQDLLNGENGGVTNISNFESGDDNFKERARIAVNQNDAKSYLKAKRIFLNHNFRVNAADSNNNLFVNHQFNYENKNFEYNQVTVNSVASKNFNIQYGATYLGANINDQTHYNKMYNKLGLIYENKKLGKFEFFGEDFRDNSYYYKILIINNQTVPSSISNRLKIIGASYEYNKNSYSGILSVSKAISTQTVSTINADLKYTPNKDNQFSLRLQNISKLPNNNFNLYQSNYQYYNWKNNFNNEKINNIKLSANTKYLNATMQLTNLKDFLYFSNDSINRQIVTPKQYNSAINYISLQVNREFKFRKFSLDNTFLFQEVKQNDKILNLPNITTRNTLYYSNFLFKKALYFQTGITLNYFTKYFANDYNSITGEFFVQKTTKIGNFPMIDVFYNAKIRQTRIFFIFEHVNTLFSKSNYLTAPNYPYRDFMFRFGLVWNFFQ
ncbi:MAG: putative porin [Flavobacterium sp.]|nr:putative porin [Flavobacterium sp.]